MKGRNTTVSAFRLVIICVWAMLCVERASASNVSLVDLGAYNGGSNLFLNSQGDVAGRLDLAGGVTHAFFYSGITGTVTDIGLCTGGNSYATGLNGFGQVTVTANNASGPEGYLYSGSTVTSLGNLGGWTFTNGLNDAGTIVGQGYLPTNNRSHPFIEFSSSY